MILDIIKPIKLLAGSHEDTGETGQGCFMNVISYLCGETKITDAVPSCYPPDHHLHALRSLFIYANDIMAPKGDGHLLLPFIDRAMSEGTKDAQYNFGLIVGFAEWCAADAAAKAVKAVKAANAIYAAKAANAIYAAKAANAAKAAYAAKAAAYAAYAAKAAADAAAKAAADAAAYAADAAAYAAKAAADAADAAAYAADAADAADFTAFYHLLRDRLIELFDAITPPATEMGHAINRRAEKLVEMAVSS